MKQADPEGRGALRILFFIRPHREGGRCNFLSSLPPREVSKNESGFYVTAPWVDGNEKQKDQRTQRSRKVLTVSIGA